MTLAERYPAGTRVEMICMNDPWAPIESGEKGTVSSVDDMGTIHVNWDNGRRLGIIYGEDTFKVIKEEKKSKYKIRATISYFYEVEVEATSEEKAEEKGLEEIYYNLPDYFDSETEVTSIEKEV